MTLDTHRVLETRIDQRSWGRRPVPGALKRMAAKGNVGFDMADALLFIPILTWPIEAFGFELASTWAFLRYAPAISDDNYLSLRHEWGGLDPHQKTVLSDEFGMGVTTAILAEHLAFTDFADTLHALQVAAGKRLRLRPARRGPSKSPDFIVRDARGRLSVLECKGTQTSAKTLEAAVAKGRVQKTNILPIKPNKIRHSLAAGVFVPLEDSEARAVFHVADPPMERSEVPNVSEEQLSHAVGIISLAKQLGASGLPELANILAQPLEEGAAATLRSSVFLTLGAIGVQEDHVFERTLVIPPLGRAFGSERAAEIAFAARVPAELLQRLLEASDLPFDSGSLVDWGTDSRWRGDTTELGRTLYSPAGISFTLEFRPERTTL